MSKLFTSRKLLSLMLVFVLVLSLTGTALAVPPTNSVLITDDFTSNHTPITSYTVAQGDELQLRVAAVYTGSTTNPGWLTAQQVPQVYWEINNRTGGIALSEITYSTTSTSVLAENYNAAAQNYRADKCAAAMTIGIDANAPVGSTFVVRAYGNYAGQTVYANFTITVEAAANAIDVDFGEVMVRFKQNGTLIWAQGGVALELDDILDTFGGFDSIEDFKLDFYLPTVGDDSIPNQASIIDAGIAAGYAIGHPPVGIGWDAEPFIGDPGAFISYFYPLEPDDHFYFDEDTGLSHAWGWGWVASYELNNVVVEPTIYLNNIPLEDGMIITFDYAPYSFIW